MTIAIGTICYIAGVQPGSCKPSVAPTYNGRVVTVVSPVLPLPQAQGGFAHRVEAAWLPIGWCYIIPACLIPIATPGTDPDLQREPEAPPA